MVECLIEGGLEEFNFDSVYLEFLWNYFKNNVLVGYININSI